MPQACARRRQPGFSLLELAVCVCIVALLVGILVERMLFYQEAAEKARMELEVTKIKLALQARIGTQIAEHKPVDYLAMAQENPVGWLGEPLLGYSGEPGQEEAKSLPGGTWYFDRQARQLVYLPRLSLHLQPDSTGRKRVRFQLQIVRAPEGARKDDAAMMGVQLAPVQPYRWF